MRVTGIDHVRDLEALVATLRNKGHEIVPAIELIEGR